VNEVLILDFALSRRRVLVCPTVEALAIILWSV
jgi:hypothetical protein